MLPCSVNDARPEALPRQSRHQAYARRLVEDWRPAWQRCAGRCEAISPHSDVSQVWRHCAHVVCAGVAKSDIFLHACSSLTAWLHRRRHTMRFSALPDQSEYESRKELRHDNVHVSAPVSSSPYFRFKRNAWLFTHVSCCAPMI